MPLSRTVRTSGKPSGSTVASDIAVGSRGSPFTASSNQACHRRNGSSAWVKSPLVNHVGCSIGAVSDIHKALSFRTAPRVPRRPRYKATRKARLWRLRATAIALALTLGAATSGCSLSYKLDSFMGKESEKPEVVSASPAQAPKQSQSAVTAPAENDLAYAKAAAAQVLGRTEKDASQ